MTESNDDPVESTSNDPIVRNHERSRRARITRRLRNESNLAHQLEKLSFYKNQHLSSSYLRVRPVVHHCHCVWESKIGLVTMMTCEYGFQNLLKAKSTSQFRLTRLLSYTKHCFVDMANHKYKPISNNMIINSTRVQRALNECVEKLQSQNPEASKSSIMEQRIKEANRLISTMKAAMSSFLLKCTGWILFAVFNRIFKTVIIHEGQMQAIENVAKRNIPLIFVPVHRSHVDYLLVTWVLFHRNLRAPLVAAGDNLRIPLFGGLLRGLGGYYIRRTLKNRKREDDELYSAILNTYMCKALSLGYNMEFFVEGGRSRSGKHCSAKEGLLTVICNDFLHGDLHDAYIVPIGINYDKLVEGNYVREQTGQPKVPETFVGAIRAIIKTLLTNHGQARIDFGVPFSLKEYYTNYRSLMESQKFDYDRRTEEINNTIDRRKLSSCVQLLVPEVTKEERDFVKSLAKHVVYSATTCQAVMSTNILAWVLCHSCRKPTRFDIIVKEFDGIRQALCDTKDIGFSGESEDVVREAIKLLSPTLVKETHCGNIISPNLDYPNVIELNYYSNCVTSIFAMDSVVATCMLSLTVPTQESFTKIQFMDGINIDELQNMCKELCSLLENEFLFYSPCSNFQSCYDDSIRRFISNGLFTEKETKSRRRNQFLDELDFEDEVVSRSASSYTVHLNDVTIKILKSYVSCLCPIIYCYYYFCLSLPLLIDAKFSEKVFVQMVQNNIESAIKNEAIVMKETLCVDTIKNAIKTFAARGVIETYIEDSVTYICLCSNFSDLNDIFNVIKRVELFTN